MTDTSTSNAMTTDGPLTAANDHASIDPRSFPAGLETTPAGSGEHRTPNGAAPVAAGLTGITVEALKETLQATGYRVELFQADDLVFLRSATGGLPFEIRLVNALPGSDSYADITFVTLFAVNGAFPHDLLNQWNRSRRFARLFLDRPNSTNEFLVLCMDVSLAGGVASHYLSTKIMIWDALVHQLVSWLRHELPQVGAPQAIASDQPGNEARA
jgi:hypothetical protein